MALNFYLQDAGSLLHDSQHLFTPVDQLTRWINLARRQVAARTGCLRALITGQAPYGTGAQPGNMIPGAAIPGTVPGNLPAVNNVAPATPLGGFNTITGVELYPFEYANPYLRVGNQGYKGIVDVMNVAVSWGGMRPALYWMPWQDLQAYARSYNIGVTSYPFLWSVSNEGENGKVWLFPYPNSALDMEWDVLCAPTDLNTDDDYDSIPDGFKNAVKYYAAGMAYLGSQRTGQWRIMMDAFADQLGISRFATDSGKVAGYYS